MARSALALLVPAMLLLGARHGNARDIPHEDVVQRFVDSHCVACHDDSLNTAGLSLEGLNPAHAALATDIWERVLRQLERRQMPPLDMPRPEHSEYEDVIGALSTQLDHAADAAPHAGRTDTFRRLTRTEYGNAIRDLLALEVDVATLLPPDEASHGFDNVTVGDLSPTLLNRYISAAEKISRLAVGGPTPTPAVTVIRLRPDITQEEHVDGLPIGTRGGALIEHTFPRDGIYAFQVRLMRDRDEHVEGLTQEHELEILLDRRRMELFTLRPPETNAEHAAADAHLNVRVPVTAGPRAIGVTFLKQASSLLVTKRQPYDAHFNFYRHPRLSPAIYEVSIEGPVEADGPGETPSRARIFATTPASADEEEQCAEQILSRLLRQAYRRAVTDDDLRQPLRFYREARAGGGLEDGIQAALSAILVNPNFLFRVERDPPGLQSGAAYAVSEFELASRLSFFLWSSLPDEELLDLAERGELSRSEVLDAQVKRMLRDRRSQSLVTNFASQWLYLRNLESLTPDLRTFPDFDDNLRQAFRRETELFFESILRDDRSVLDLLHADYTFLNERLAKHYDIPHVYGSRFRRVALGMDEQRGGLLRQGSILMATSYATRTSPVLRGKWILENLLGCPLPPQPKNVPPLKDNTVAAELPVRQRLASHRANPACASCHNLMDPVGFALENFDAVGRWRDIEAGAPVDASGGLPNGTECDGVEGLEQGLIERPQLFVGTLAEKLLTYALGRGMEPADAPAVRQIVRDAAADEYRFSSLIVGIANSRSFRMRTTR